MSTIIVPLSDILLDPQKPVDLTTLPVDQSIQLIKQSYGFLSDSVEVSIENGIATITLPDEKSKKVNEALDWFDRGLKKAKQGDYQNAIQLLKRTLEYLPAHTDARRNLAMAYLETGNSEEALNQLIDVLRLDPKDVWGYILLGNIYVKNKEDRKTGEQFYKKALDLNPKDPYLLNNYAAVKAENGQTDESQAMFEKAIEIDPSYPNSFYGLATLLSRMNREKEALTSLEKLFAQPISSDPRAAIVYNHSRALFKSLNEELADENYESIMAFVHSRANAIEGITGYPMEIIEDDSLQGVTAKSELAWRHKTNRHIIRHRSGSKSIVPHLIMHEMEHILLEHEAREAGKNKNFIVTEDQRRFGHEQIQPDLHKLDDLELDRSRKEEIISRWLFGLTNQLYNCPVDMVIEKRLFEKYADLRPYQFVSLAQTQSEYLKVLTEPEIQKISPRLIMRSSTAMNCSYALFADWLYGNATEYSKPYKNSNVFALGEKLFSTFLSKPGEQYILVVEFARILKLEGWFTLEEDRVQTEQVQEGATNPDLLKQKESATVMYCLDTLKRFENMPVEKIKEIAFEVGLVGTTGIDYTKPDRRYSLKSLPGEQFTGLQMLVFMYVGFKKIDPTVNTGLDFEDAYQTALKLYENK
jgi:tetratricopeptide (TPR) repeat protein